jgi:hypothetical protein
MSTKEKAIMIIKEDATVRELIEYLRDRRLDTTGSISIYNLNHGDMLPEGVTIVISDHAQTCRELERIYDEF